MTSLQNRQSLINEIAELQHQQLIMHREAGLNSWNEEQALAFDTRFARIASLWRELTALNEAARS